MGSKFIFHFSLVLGNLDFCIPYLIHFAWIAALILQCPTNTAINPSVCCIVLGLYDGCHLFFISRYPVCDLLLTFVAICLLVSSSHHSFLANYSSSFLRRSLFDSQLSFAFPHHRLIAPHLLPFLWLPFRHLVVFTFHWHVFFVHFIITYMALFTYSLQYLCG